MKRSKMKKNTISGLKNVISKKKQKRAEIEHETKKFLTDDMKNTKKIAYNINMVFDAKYNIVFNNQNEIFDLFKSDRSPNQVGLYPIKNSNFAIWLPLLDNDSKRWHNEIDALENTIIETPEDKKQRKDGFKKGLLRIVFVKYKNQFKFKGVFMEYKSINKKYIYKKVSETIILQ